MRSLVAATSLPRRVTNIAWGALFERSVATRSVVIEPVPAFIECVDCDRGVLPALLCCHHPVTAVPFSSSVTSVTIASAASMATFWYGDTATGTPTITASATSYLSGTQNETITSPAPEGLSLTSITDSGGSVSCGTPSSDATTCTASVSSGGSFTAEVDFVNSVSSPVVYSTTQASTITESGHDTGSVTIAAGATTSTSTITASTSGSSTKTSTLKFGPYTVTINVTG